MRDDRSVCRTARGCATTALLAAGLATSGTGTAWPVPVSEWLGPVPGIALAEKAVPARASRVAAQDAGAGTAGGAAPGETAAAPAPPAEDGAATGPAGGDGAPFVELNEALAAARAKLEELANAAEIAAEISGLRGEVRALQADNQRLEAALAEAIAKRDEAVARSHSELAELRRQLQAAERQVEEAREARDQAQTATAEAEADVAKTRDELDTARTAIADAEDELTVARGQARQARSRAERLEQELAQAAADAGQLRTENLEMEEQLAVLREAADEATELARQNLTAMEDRIGMLHAALADAQSAIEPGAGTEAVDPPAPDEGSEDAGADPAGAVLPPPVKPADGLPHLQLTGSMAAVAGLTTLKADQTWSTDARLQSIADFTANLPLEARLQAQSLLVDLDADADADGVRMLVPGEKLFASNRKEIGEEAYDTLAKVAEVIGIYTDHEVLITGHTDAIGDAAYNRALSERRADLVKEFFVDNFGLEAARLMTQGVGEDYPIATNATRAGRHANRRVEVMILN